MQNFANINNSKVYSWMEMSHRAFIAQQLADLFAVLSHPVRIRIVVELRSGELCVSALQERLAISHSAVSQHLALLKSHRLIRENKKGRHVFYRLAMPDMTAWIVEAIPFIVPDDADIDQLKSAAEHALGEWSDCGAVSVKDSRDYKNPVMPD